MTAGQIDPQTGVCVKLLIIARTTYVVYLGADLYTYWWVTDAHSSTILRFGEILARVAKLEARPIGHLKPDRAEAFRALVAEGVARALEDRVYEGANAILDEAEKYYEERSAEVARRWLLACGLVGVLGGIVYLGAIYAYLPSGPYWIGSVPMIVALGCGAIGASLSLISRVGKLAVDPGAGFGLHSLESLARIVVGMVGGGLTFLAIKADLVATALIDDSVNEWAIVMLFTTVAGLSERFVPQLVGQIEDGSMPGAQPSKAPKA